MDTMDRHNLNQDMVIKILMLETIKFVSIKNKVNAA